MIKNRGSNTITDKSRPLSCEDACILGRLVIELEEIPPFMRPLNCANVCILKWMNSDSGGGPLDPLGFEDTYLIAWLLNKIGEQNEVS